MDALIFNVMLRMNIIDLYHMSTTNTTTQKIYNDLFFQKSKMEYDNNNILVKDVYNDVNNLDKTNVRIELPNFMDYTFLNDIFNITITFYPDNYTFIEIKKNIVEIYVMNATHHFLHAKKIMTMTEKQINDLIAYCIYYIPTIRTPILQLGWIVFTDGIYCEVY